MKPNEMSAEQLLRRFVELGPTYPDGVSQKLYDEIRTELLRRLEAKPNPQPPVFGPIDEEKQAQFRQLMEEPEPRWNRQESCSECDGDGCAKCEPESVDVAPQFEPANKFRECAAEIAKGFGKHGESEEAWIYSMFSSYGLLPEPSSPSVGAQEWHRENRVRFLTGEEVLPYGRSRETIEYLDEVAMLEAYHAFRMAALAPTQPQLSAQETKHWPRCIECKTPICEHIFAKLTSGGLSAQEAARELLEAIESTGPAMGNGPWGSV